MVQWHECKKKAHGTLLLFQMGDFFEAFYDDALILSKELDLTLTKRQDIPMSGVPVHTIDSYVDKLIQKGYRVSIAEQVEDPDQAKGLVKREVVRIITPATLLNSSLIHEKSNNYFAAVTQVGHLMGLAFLDLTTAEFQVLEFDSEKELQTEIFRLKPKEFLTSDKFNKKHPTFFDEVKKTFTVLYIIQEDWRFDYQLAYESLLSHFGVQNLDGFGLKAMMAAINAGGALLTYVRDTLLHSVSHITQIGTYSTSNYMSIDCMTQNNLELTDSIFEGGKKGTLLEVLDKTETAMGGRMLRQWIKRPLLSVTDIQMRQGAIHSFVSEPRLRSTLKRHLVQIRDLERLMMRISLSSASPRDIKSLGSSFEQIPLIKKELLKDPDPLLCSIEKGLVPLPEMTQLIKEALTDEPPLRIGDGPTFRSGYSSELDELYILNKNGKDWIRDYQLKLREETGIKTLKVGFNRAFGYFIEVSRGQAIKMPESFIRRQTLINAERYISPELKEYEMKVLNAEERIQAIEAELFQALRKKVLSYTTEVTLVAHEIAKLDCLLSLAEVAQEREYVCPNVHLGHELIIELGRHPVIEAINLRERFIANDTHMNGDSDRMLIITGPNMAGKSTYIRQTALLTIMAQMGSFIPAKGASIGIVDKVFTRIGASDNLTQGQSTFMVEMTETANILNNATSRSLVILDEIGRGTSTYDGISIAWAVAEYLLTAEGRKAKTLFATHYWELTKLEERIPGAVNYNVAVQESEDEIYFLRKIVRGGTDKSYGIHVARLAGMPTWVLSRAHEILEHLEENSNRKNAFEPKGAKLKPKLRPKRHFNDYQLALFT